MKDLLKHFSLLDRLNTVFLGIIIVIWFFSIPYSPYSYEPLLVFILTAATIWLSVYFRKENKTLGFAKAFRLAYPLIYLFVIFESFFMILPFINPNRYDELLTNIDFAMFGVHPTVWIEEWSQPWLTDLFYSLYIFYFPMPLFILSWLYRQKRFVDLDKSVWIYMLTYYGAYLGYFLVPAAGPRFYEPVMTLQQTSLDGIFLAVPVRTIINFMEPNKLDAFPSLHAAISFTTLLLMGKYNKTMFKVFLPIITGIMISLVYCRYHYVIDMIAGISWSMITFVFGQQLYDKFAKDKIIPFYQN
jgi:membrane-associated phospholipid phosphatase